MPMSTTSRTLMWTSRCQIVGICGRVQLRQIPRWHWACWHAEGSRRYLDATVHLHPPPDELRPPGRSVDEVAATFQLRWPCHQRPGVPGIRSTSGTGTEAAQQPAARVLPSGPATAAPMGIIWPRRCGWRPGRAALPGMRGAVSGPVGRKLAFNSRGPALQIGSYQHGAHGGPTLVRIPDHRCSMAPMEQLM